MSRVTHWPLPEHKGSIPQHQSASRTMKPVQLVEDRPALSCLNETWPPLRYVQPVKQSLTSCSLPKQSGSFLSLSPSEHGCFWKSQTNCLDRSCNTSKETRLRVRDPRTHIQHGKATYTDYKIEIKTSDIAFTLSYSTVQRRFSEFAWLRWRLAREVMNNPPPPLPKKKVFGRFLAEFIKQRERELEAFLLELIEQAIFLSNAALHLFLQTNFTVKEMERCLDLKSNGNIHHTIMLTARDDSDSTQDHAYWSLDLKDFDSSSSQSVEALSSGYHGDIKAPVEEHRNSTKSLCSDIDTERPGFSDPSEFDCSFEDFLEACAENNGDRRESRCKLLSVGSPAGGFTVEEYLFENSEEVEEVDPYVVFRTVDKPRTESTSLEEDRLLETYEVVSLF